MDAKGISARITVNGGEKERGKDTDRYYRWNLSLYPFPTIFLEILAPWTEMFRLEVLRPSDLTIQKITFKQFPSAQTPLQDAAEKTQRTKNDLRVIVATYPNLDHILQ